MYEKPTEVSSGIPEYMKASTSETDIRTDIIPMTREEEWMQIDYYDMPFGVKVWGSVDSEIAGLERKMERKKKDRTASLTANSIEIEEMYHKALLRKMVKKINGEVVDKTFWDLSANQTMFRVAQKWIKFKLEGEPYPDPKWLLLAKDIEEEPDPTTSSDPGPDGQVFSGREEEKDSS